MSHTNMDTAGSRLEGSNLHSTPGPCLVQASLSAIHETRHPERVFYQSERKRGSEVVVIDLVFLCSFRAMEQ